MMRSFRYLLMILVIVGFVSCSKDGPEGPLGPQGEKGDKGDKGADGTLLRYGNAAPSASLGQEGDFYMDMVNHNLYGPKTSSSWGTPINLKGETGATGAEGEAGSQFLSGTAAPATQGNIGDFYFRTTTVTLYGPKTPTGWGTGVSLRGPKGDPGNANVKVFTKHIEDLTWTVVSGGNSHLFLEIAAPEVLTRTAVNNHIILVYVRTSDFSSWALLPYYTHRDIRVTADVAVGKLTLRRDQDGSPSTQSWFSDVRVVVIEPSESGQLMHNIRDFKDYHLVKNLYDLKD